jgi:sulfopyruvate decarboxylase subunit alpha
VPIKTSDLVDAFVEQGYDFASGVPCTILAGLLRQLPKRMTYVPATREDEAVGMAVGAWLGGKKPLVLMQNSGLGNCVNALTSLTLLYRVPLLMVIGWRGDTKEDAPEHWIMGEKTPALLDALGVRWRELDGGYMKALGDDGVSALVVKGGVLA